MFLCGFLVIFFLYGIFVLTLFFIYLLKKLKTCKTANVLNYIETNKVKKNRYLIKQDNTIYKMKRSFFSRIGQNK